MRHRHYRTQRGAERYRDKLRRDQLLTSFGPAALDNGAAFIVVTDDFGWAVALIDRNGKRIALCS
jgi:hypothetical protein